MKGFGSKDASAAGLPFAGIPPEMVEKTNALMKDEPDYNDLNF